MNIAIDCRSVSGSGKGEMAGIGHYAWHLVRQLLAQDDENRYTLFFDGRADRNRAHEMLGANRKARAEFLPLSRWKRFLPYTYSHRLVASAIAKSGADVTHFPSGSLPTGFRGTSVLTVHDLAIYAHPEWFPGGQFFSRRFVVPASLRRATRIIAVSQATKRDIEKLFAVPEAKISVIHEGVEPSSVRAITRDSYAALKRQGLSDPYVLFLGTVEPRKNVLGLVEAYATLAEKFPKLVGRTKLVIAGARGWKSDATFARIRTLNAKFGAHGPGIKVLGYLPAGDKAHVMARALAFAFPSFDEGFGLPPLEAMSAGVPVIVSDRGSLPEIAARAGILVDPTHKAELMLAMKRLLEDPASRAEWGRKALERSLEFSWERCAGETLEAYEQAARA